jgi:hypothetical protein
MVDYATTSEVKAQAAAKTGSEWDTTIAALIAATSRWIDRRCRRPDGFVAAALATARVFAGSGGAVQWIDECAALPTLVEVKASPTDSAYVAWAASDWIAGRGDPERSPDFNTTPYQWLMVDPSGDQSHFTSGSHAYLRGFRPQARKTSAVPTVRVTTRWGYALAVPEPIKEACIIICVQSFKRAESSWADALQMAESGRLLYRQGVDPAAEKILVEGRFIRPAIG